MYWNIVAHNEYDFEDVDNKCNFENEENSFFSCTNRQCVSPSWNIERDRNCFCRKACGNKIILRNEVKHVAVLNPKSKGLGLNPNE